MLKQLKNLSNPTKELLVMGILNVTPDSFYDGGEFLNINDAIKQANKMMFAQVSLSVLRYTAAIQAAIIGWSVLEPRCECRLL